MVDGEASAKLLGEGAIAKVVSIFDASLNQQVAIKMFSINKQSIESFEREIAALTLLANKERICEMINFSIEDITLSITMKQYETDLYDFKFNAKHLKKNNMRVIFTNTCKSLKILHENGVAHLDLKPENVLVNSDTLMTFICDFGCAHIINAEKNSKVDYKLVSGLGSRGSTSYVAPEVVRNPNHYDPFAADIFSLGVTLYVLATGYYPLFGENGKLVVPPKIKIDPQLLSLLRKVLHINPEKRANIHQVLSHRYINGSVWSKVKKKLFNR
mmetsp:Transcript_132364/g.197239  ORF Transcript_132364/g.197239 Transcript_132364/m.197239 type:complete len:272 (-) Transcript_132364:73-888(-)